MSKADFITIKITPEEGHHIWALLDGCLDAGSRDGGLSEAERNAAHAVLGQLCGKTEKGE